MKRYYVIEEEVEEKPGCLKKALKFFGALLLISVILFPTVWGYILGCIWVVICHLLGIARS